MNQVIFEILNKAGQKMLKSDFPVSENDKYLSHLISQAQNLNVNDSKHIEIDDQYCVFLIRVDDNHYTGWIYLQNGEIPVLAFRNFTLKDIVAQAYEDHIWIVNMVGDSLYNQQMVNDIDKTIDEMSPDIATSPPISEIDLENERRKTTMACEVVSYIDAIDPKAMIIQNDPDQVQIKLIKSENSMEDNFTLWQMKNDLDPQVEDFFKSEKERLEKSTNLDFGDSLQKSKSDEIVEQQFSKFDYLSKSQVLQALNLATMFSDPEVGFLE